MFEIHLFNLILFAFSSAILFGLYRKIFKDQQSEQKDKGLYWLAASVATHLISSAWWCIANYLEPDSYVWAIALPLTILSILNSIFIILALQHFEHKPPYFKDERLFKPLLAIGAIAIIATVVLHKQHGSSTTDEAYRSKIDDKKMAKQINSFLSEEDRIDAIHLIAMSGTNVLKDTTWNRKPNQRQHVKALKENTRVADEKYTQIVELLLLYFFLYTFRGRNHTVLKWLCVGFIILFVLSQSLISGLGWTAGLIFLTEELPAVVNSLQIVFYLLVLLTWVLRSENKPTDAVAEMPIISISGEDSETASPIGAIEKLRQKADELNPIQREILTLFCQGRTKAEIGQKFKPEKTKKAAERWVDDRLKDISLKLQIDNGIENHIQFAFKSGLASVADIRIRTIFKSDPFW